MTTFFKDGIISKDGKNMGVKVPPTGTNAPGQSVAGGNIPEFASDIVKGAKDIGQDIFDGISGGAEDLVSGLRGKNLPNKKKNNFEAKAPADRKSVV